MLKCHIQHCKCCNDADDLTALSFVGHIRVFKTYSHTFWIISSRRVYNGFLAYCSIPCLAGWGYWNFVSPILYPQFCIPNFAILCFVCVHACVCSFSHLIFSNAPWNRYDSRFYTWGNERRKGFTWENRNSEKLSNFYFVAKYQEGGRSTPGLKVF